MFVQLHAIQNHPPSALNRDNNGSPKDCYFGNILRGRVSAQCLKRLMRVCHNYYRAYFKNDDLFAVRTRKLGLLLSKYLVEMGVPEEDIQAICARAGEFGRKSENEDEGKGKGKKGKKNADENEEEVEELTEDAATNDKNGNTKQLIFIGNDEARELAKRMLSLYKEFGAKKWATTKFDEIRERLGTLCPRSVDIALFGRMTTDVVFQDVQAAVYVAHAFSTHALNKEFDDITSVDDLIEAWKTAGAAGFLDTQEFNSCTYYRYALLDVDRLLKNLGGDMEMALTAVRAFVDSFVNVIPTGKQHGSAAFNPPEFVFVEIMGENKGQLSLANAFLKPVRPTRDQSLMEVSAEALADYARKMLDGMYASDHKDSLRAYATIHSVEMEKATKIEDVLTLGSWVSEQVESNMSAQK